ncbi:MAG: ABC transporter ATP-binding protein [Trichloromonas sp.]|nr:ABC transporter ATP-binding protein [Trichloromonas sp.]
MPPLLDVRNLMTYFFTAGGLVKAVRGVDFTIETGETLALVGESGCGKSMTALSLLRLVPEPGRIVEGQIFFAGNDLLHVPDEEMRRVRGNQIAMIFQEPMTALNPVLRIGEQIAEVLRLHKGQSPAEALETAADLLHQVGIPSPKQRIREYPHQLSGGMRQRVVIAMALACDPRLLIADEPTTALDVTIQAQIMDLLRRLKSEREMATLLITHDLGVVAENADRVAIMYNGLILEYAPVRDIFNDPRHPYTSGLLACIPKLGEKRRRLTTVNGQGAGGNSPLSFLDRCPPEFAPRQGNLPGLRETAPGHLVRRWED